MNITREGKIMTLITIIIGVTGQIVALPMILGKVYPPGDIIPHIGVALIAGTAGCILRIIFNFDKYYPDDTTPRKENLQ
jgi:hypothetical protein